MRIAYFDAPSGIAGDMAVAALLDAASDKDVSIEALREALAALPVGGYEIATERADVMGIPALRFRVSVAKAGHPHRNWSAIESLLGEARRRGLAAGIYQRSMAIFEGLARAEADVHGVALSEVTFQEVGAVDSIVDIVATAWCLEALGIERCFVSPVPAGSGYVESAHGRLPIPAPATARLLRGFEVVAGDGKGELVTPTGAAILAAMARPFRPLFTLQSIGTGAGTMQLADRPNVLRVFIGEAEETSDENLVMIESDIDDMTPAALARACERLRETGARDVSVLPLQMKKNRLGMRLCVLADLGAVETVALAVLLHTSSLGVRYRAVHRQVLVRRSDIVDTDYGPMSLKVAVRPDGTETAEPEFEEVARTASALGRPFADIRAAALAAWKRA